MPQSTTHPIHLILSAGTRIVTRHENRTLGGASIIPAGAVGEIIVSPDDATHAYKIRFNDNAETMLRRSEFSILKEFKNDDASASHDFEEWKPFIIYQCIVGSQAFGLSTETSDIDYRGIYLPPADLHW